jgi:hypothetical protein
VTPSPATKSSGTLNGNARPHSRHSRGSRDHAARVVKLIEQARQSKAPLSASPTAGQSTLSPRSADRRRHLYFTGD